MANRLANETSPYLLQHADNPVDWHPWGAEAFRVARELRRPILLSIGYSACHWCHVMARESFSDPATAALMNSGFVNIKVDREERPDVDAIHMAALQALTGAGGWPLTAVLTPEGEPFFAGTYWPSEARHGLPAFRDILQAAARAWEENRAEVQLTAADLRRHLEQQVQAGLNRLPISENGNRAALSALLGQLDPQNGGFGTEPRFPQHSALRFLLARPEVEAREAALLTLRHMARGGIFDQLAGGLSRYTVDAAWTVPHFEKMLFDSAQFLGLAAIAWRLSGEAGFRSAALLSADWLQSHLHKPDGSFMTALSAESEGVEGEYYLWELAQFRTVLHDSGLAGFAADAFGVSAAGNFEGRNILTLSAGAWEQAGDPRLEEARRLLHAARKLRPLPDLDDKVLTSWNGLTIANLSLAGRLLQEPALVEQAGRAAAVFLPALQDGQLRHSRTGDSTLLLEDLAHLGSGLLELYQAQLLPELLTGARTAARQIADRFSDGGQLFSTETGGEDLLYRPRELADSGAPADVAEAARLLLRIGRITGEERLLQLANASLETAAPLVAAQPALLGSSLVAMDEWLAPVSEIALAGDPADSRLRALVAEVHGRFLPHSLLLHESAGDLELFDGRSALRGVPTAWVCTDRSCLLPVTEPDQLAAQLPEVPGAGR